MTAISTAELIIYATLSIPTLYILFKHGRDGLLGWIYLFAFCSLRVIGSAMDLSGNTSAGIISSVGLSPLLLAASGILHEARNYYCDPMSRKLKWTVVVFFHILVTTGLVIVATGASSLQSSDGKPTDASKASKNDSSVRTGMSLLTLAWAIIAVVSVWILARPAKSPMPKFITAAGTRLLWSVLVSDIFSGIRVIYSLIALVTKDENLNPQTGSLAIRVVLGLIPELISVLAFVTAGLATRHVARELKAKADLDYVELPNRR
ncbi:hypothetical protein MKX08_002171 [Trichoderma sp. CBMAI-0020]|nr:hypothetical protein MKX08_002171 [Trichoderma sp. CBMAI-0020]WOD46537.1 hypothetical protein [Trichoderma atroviride]